MSDRQSARRVDHARVSPEVGDVVLREDWRRDGTRRFVFQAVPGPEQYTIKSRSRALSQALDFARRLRVRLWLTDGTEHFTLIDDFRAAPRSRPERTS